MSLDSSSIDFEKSGGLVPAIVQHAASGEVLMLGYMNEEALEKTQDSGKVTFFSRSRDRLWTKGETSGNTLELVSVLPDCDRDALLVRALPKGPVCHTGTKSCFGEAPGPDSAFIGELETIISERATMSPDESYTAKLMGKGIVKIAQKLGEEGVETALAATNEDDEAVKGEAADLVYHLLVLLKARGLTLGDVAEKLRSRHKI